MHVGIPMLQTKFEVKIVKYNSSAKQCYVDRRGEAM